MDVFDVDDVVKNKEKKGSINVTLVMLTWLNAIGATIALFMTVQVRRSSFNEFVTYVTVEMRQPDYIFIFTMGSYLAAMSLFVTSVYTSISALLLLKTNTKVGIVLMMFSSIACLAGGLYSTLQISGFGGTVNGNTRVLDGRNREIQDFASAMYGECCAAKGLVSDREAATELWLGFLDEEDIETNLQRVSLCVDYYRRADFRSIKVALEHCIGDRYHVEYFRAATTEWVCEKLDTSVDIGNTELAGYELSDLIGDLESIDIINQASKAGNYGCGGGKVKAFMLAVFLWFQNVTTPLATTLMAVGAISLLLGFFAMASLCVVSSGEDYGVDMDLVNQYMNRVGTSPTSEEEIIIGEVAEDPNKVKVKSPQDLDDSVF